MAVEIVTRYKNYNFLEFSQGFSRENYCVFSFEKLLGCSPGVPPGLSGNYAHALKLIADTEHGVGTGPDPKRIDSVSRRASWYLET